MKKVKADSSKIVMSVLAKHEQNEKTNRIAKADTKRKILTA